jgi:pimeloyl-ACP methyl ester carboxylesterase
MATPTPSSSISQNKRKDSYAIDTSGTWYDGEMFDWFAVRLAQRYHVYGVTRRGYGASDKPDPVAHADYSNARLAEDVADVIDALKLARDRRLVVRRGGDELAGDAASRQGRQPRLS